MKKQKVIHQLPKTNIVIDYWKFSKDGDTYIRFMTIFRVENDQLQYIKQNNYEIYTSSKNKKLLEFHKIPTDRIIAIEPGNCIEIIDEHAKYSFEVSTIESNYCIGSCMFLFQGPFGNILYTGFFRPDKPSDPLRNPILQHLIYDKHLDEVYIDNSYAAEHCQFPSRANTIKETVHLIKEHPTHKIIIAGNRFGKEEIFHDIAASLDEQIGVSKSKYEELSFIMTEQFLQKFSPNQHECRIVVEDELLSLDQCKKKQIEEGSCIIILLTAQYMCEKMRSRIPQLSNLHILPYSSHASHFELMEFLYNLKSRKIMPIILSGSDNTIIPKKMLEMCYTDEDSLSLQDSDFYFDTSINIQTSENECGPVHDTETSHHNCRNPINNISGNTLMERTGNDFRDEQIVVLDASSNIGRGNRETDSIDSNVSYRESKPVAFISLLEVQDEYLYNETSNIGDDLVDPLSVNESSHLSITDNSLKTRFNFIARSSTTKFRDNGMTSFIPENVEMNETLPLGKMPLDPALHSNNNKIEKRKECASAVSNLENHHSQTSCNEEVFADEISSVIDIIGSDGPIRQEVNSESSISLAISSLSDSMNVEFSDSSSTLNEESINEKDVKLGTILHHICLVTTTEDWQQTNLTEDTWAALQGVEFS